MNEVARFLGIGSAKTVRKWVHQIEVDTVQTAGRHVGRVGGAEAAATRENAP